MNDIMFYGLIILFTIFSMYSIYKSIMIYRKTQIIPIICSGISILLLCCIGGLLYTRYAHYEDLVSFVELLIVAVIGTFILWYFVSFDSDFAVQESIDKNRKEFDKNRKEFVRKIHSKYMEGRASVGSYVQNDPLFEEYNKFITSYENKPYMENWFKSSFHTNICDFEEPVIDSCMNTHGFEQYAYCEGYTDKYSELMKFYK